MSRSAIFVVALLTLVSMACAWKNGRAPHGDALAATAGLPEAVATWGASQPDTELEWSFPDPPNPPFVGTPDFALTEVCFTRASSVLDREARGALRTVVEDLTAGGDREEIRELKLLVLGFADGVGEASQAEALGLSRAEAVRTQLVTLGFPSSRIQVASYGARYSVAQPWEVVRQEHERSVMVWALR